MNRQNLPAQAGAPDMPARIAEIRFPERARGHEARNGREVGA